MTNDIQIGIDVDINEAKAKAKKLEDAFDFKADIDFSQANKEAESFVDKIKGGLSGVGDGFSLDSVLGGIAGGGALGLATTGFELIAGSIGDVYNNANEFNNALLDIQAKTGATKDEMKLLETASKEAFLGGVGESVADATRVIGEAQTLLGSTFTGAELGDFTAKANALGNLFDKDVNEVLQKATPFIKQFGLSSDEAFNLLSKGLREGKTPSDDLLDTLSEYSQLISKAGFSAGEFTQILTNGAGEGIFSLDKLGDAIKETEIRLKAGDIGESLTKIGGSNDFENNLIRQIQAIEKAGSDGTKTVKEVLQESTELINNAYTGGQISESLSSQLQVAIAGTPAEDIGTELFGKIFSAPLDEKAINESAQKIGEEVSNAVGQYTTFDQVQRQASLFFTEVGQGSIQLFQGVLDNLTKFFAPIIQSFQELGGIFSEIFTEIFGEAEGGIDIMEILTDVIGGMIRNAFLPLKLAIQATVEIMKFMYGIVLKGIKLFKEFYNNSEILKATFSAIGDVVGFVGGLIRELLETLGILDPEELTAPIKELEKEEKKLTVATDELTTSQKELEKQAPKTAKAVKKATYSDIINQLAILNIEGKKATETYRNLVSQALNLRKSDEELKESLESVNKELNIYYNGIKDIASLSEKDFDVYSFLEKAVKNARENIKKLIIPAKVVPDFLEYDKESVALFGADLIDRANEIQNQLELIGKDTTLTEKDRLEQETKLKKEFADLQFQSLLNSVSDIDNAYLNSAVTIANSIKDNIDLIDKGGDSWIAYGNIVSSVLKQGEELFKDNTEIQRAFAVSQAIINTALAATQAYAQLGPIAGTIAAAVISSFGALQVATILGAEGGVVGLDGSYNKKPGRTDTIPFMLAKGESVINAQSTAVNRPFLEYANNGGNLADLFNPLLSETRIQNRKIDMLNKNLSRNSGINLIVDNRNNSRIRAGRL